MPYNTHNYVDGQVLFAKDLNEMDSQIKKYEHSVANLEAAVEGKLYREDVDSTEAYRKDIATDVLPFASLDKIGGKSVVWNQLELNNRTSNYTTNGITYSKNPDMSWSATGTATGSALMPVSSNSASIKFTENHVYYISGSPNGGALSTYSVALYSFTDSTNRVTEFGEGTIYKSDNTEELSYRLRIYSGSSTNGVFRPCVVDLTLMFGSGNEPMSTNDQRIEFLKTYFAAHHQYNAGEIIHADVDSIVSVGKNFLDFAYILKNVFKANHKVISDSRIQIMSTGTGYSAPYQFADDDITLSMSGNVENYGNASGWCIQLLNKNDVAVATIGRGYTSASNVKACKLRINYTSTDSNSGAYFDNIQIEKSEKVTSFSPYRVIDNPIPESIRNIEGYGWSAGSVYNEVDFVNRKFIKRVGRVSISASQNWYKSGNTKGDVYYTSNALNPAGKSYGAIFNADIVGVRTVFGEGISGDLKYISINETTNTRVDIRLGNYGTTSIDDFKSYLSSISDRYLYYELNEPVITDLPDDIFNTVEVEAGGSIMLHQPDSKCLPIPNQETFVVKVGDA